MELARATLGRVLVIDDDEIAKALLKDTLERAGFSVWALLSPVGATQLIERMNIQVAVVDVSMPVVSGDRLVRLLRSWEPFRHLPIVLVSGMPAAQLAEVARGLPDVSIVTKVRVADDLPNTVRRAVAASGTRPGSNTQAATGSGARMIDVTEAFLRQLPDQMTQAMALWERVCIGKDSERGLLRGLLHTLKGRSDLLGYEQMAELLSVLLGIVSALPAQAMVQDAIRISVIQALRVVAGLARAPAGSIERFDPGATLAHLRDIRDKLLVR